MRLTKIQELGSRLEKLLSTLKKNREAVPPDVLRTYYRQPYEALLRQIGGTATAFVKAVLTDRLILNPDIPITEQAAVVNQVIADSGMERQMSSCISRTYNSDQLYQMALELRQKIECALWPYIDLKTCLVFDLDNPETEPVTYNTLTRQILRNGIWTNQELNLWGKFLFYPNSKDSINTELRKEKKYEYQYGTENNSAPVGSGNRRNIPQAAPLLLGS